MSRLQALHGIECSFNPPLTLGEFSLYLFAFPCNIFGTTLLDRLTFCQITMDRATLARFYHFQHFLDRLNRVIESWTFDQNQMTE